MRRLEDRLAPTCSGCRGLSVRVVVIDGVTNEVLSESRPGVCPSCGSLPQMTREYWLEPDEEELIHAEP
jgi:hypothetical protein